MGINFLKYGIQKRKEVEFEKANSGLIDDLREISSWNSFASSLVEQYSKRGTLSDKQTGAAIAMLMKVKANKAQKAEAPSVDLSNVVAMFNKAHEAIKTPKFRYEDLVISRAPDHGVNAGALYIKIEGEYAGKVKDGKFFANNDFFKRSGFKLSAQGVRSKLEQISKDPLSSAVAYGKKTGNCSCCGRDLTRHDSIERGIGPICAEKWGLL